MSKAAGKAKAALDSARAEAQAVGDGKLAAIRTEADADKEAKLAELRAQIESARTSLRSNLDGFAADMASKILGRSL